MQVKKINTTNNLNNERLTSGNKLFLHTFKNFSTNSVNISTRAYLVRGLFFILIFLSIVYMAFVVLTVLNIVNKKESLAQTSDANIASAKLNREYNSLVANLNLDYALNHGYVETEMHNFASRKSEAVSLSFLYED